MIPRLSRTVVAGVDLRDELARLCALTPFAGIFTGGPPRLRVRRTWIPFRVHGYTSPEQGHVILTLGTFLDAHVVRHTLLHELCHFRVIGHGRPFRRLLARATAEAAGIDVREGLPLKGYAFDTYCIEMRQESCG